MTMNQQRIRWKEWMAAALIGAAGFAGCEKKSADAPAPPADAKAVEAKLAKADAFDGKVDKVVTKCLGCGLGMDGKKELAATTAGYTLYLCSAHCKSEFEKDPNKAVLALQIPGG
jgi:YHS domain-containing protein